MTKEVVIYLGNVILAICAFVLVGLGKITWVEAAAFIAAMIMPSAAHLALQKRTVKQAVKDELNK